MTTQGLGCSEVAQAVYWPQRNVRGVEMIRLPAAKRSLGAGGERPAADQESSRSLTGPGGKTQRILRGHRRSRQSADREAGPGARAFIRACELECLAVPRLRLDRSVQTPQGVLCKGWSRQTGPGGRET